ncbi:MAG: bifunctional UDP-3-O-[3-hydroxymyristoyl] N-acetylglucosamine deacetylase/3-hydroxyacyl-ACP dehydratase [Opitutae bacterium]|nr:bifunctional UDP-3-O-[3-hydroxymyristoyl] N-acetylglucosamine deacetylase/3-hydroxyacyl-ACP dehydratase [Opitutae bacterium]
MKQRTIGKDVSVKGKALHTGQEVIMTLRPAPVDSGIIFRRTDVYGKPEFRPVADMADVSIRNTTVSHAHVKLHTIEHVNSALNGMGIDNCIVEMNASEPPILDGSARPVVHMIREAGIVDQEKERVYYSLKETVSVTDGNRSIIAIPFDGLRITCTSADDRGVHTQNLTIDISPDIYEALIAPARTFTIYEEIEQMLKQGLIQGGSLDSAIVIRGDKIISKEPLRFHDEFVRHKIMDLIGDLVLIGAPLKAHIVAVRTGHALNAKLTAAIRKQMLAPAPKKKGAASVIPPNAIALNIRQILNLVPHRYPFALIDRVTKIDHAEKCITAIKNVTLNEPFFQGHFPGNPVMPGVLQLEMMAQASGLLLLSVPEINDGGEKLTFFMSADKVKFRKPITPGDQVIIESKVTKNRGNKIFTAAATCKVDDEVVSSAEVMFTIMPMPKA